MVIFYSYVSLPEGTHRESDMAMVNPTTFVVPFEWDIHRPMEDFKLCYVSSPEGSDVNLPGLLGIGLVTVSHYLVHNPQ